MNNHEPIWLKTLEQWNVNEIEMHWAVGKFQSKLPHLSHIETMSAANANHPMPWDQKQSKRLASATYCYVSTLYVPQHTHWLGPTFQHYWWQFGQAPIPNNMCTRQTQKSGMRNLVTTGPIKQPTLDDTCWFRPCLSAATPEPANVHPWLKDRAGLNWAWIAFRSISVFPLTGRKLWKSSVTRTVSSEKPIATGCNTMRDAQLRLKNDKCSPKNVVGLEMPRTAQQSEPKELQALEFQHKLGPCVQNIFEGWGRACTWTATWSL